MQRLEVEALEVESEQVRSLAPLRKAALGFWGFLRVEGLGEIDFTGLHIIRNSKNSVFLLGFQVHHSFCVVEHKGIIVRTGGFRVYSFGILGFRIGNTWGLV